MPDTVFYNDLAFTVPEEVYVPREDSRLLADQLVTYPLTGKTLLEIGTGSGFLAVIAASEGADVTATDISDTALQAARDNAERNDVSLSLKRSYLFEAIDSRFDLLIFNPPYLPGSREGKSMEQLAWCGGESGREVLDRFISQADGYLADKGVILVVQSSLTGEEETVEAFTAEGFEVEKVASQKVSWEELQVFAAAKN